MGTFPLKRSPTDPHLIDLRLAQWKGTSGDRGFQVRTHDGLGSFDGKSPKSASAKVTRSHTDWAARDSKSSASPAEKKVLNASGTVVARQRPVKNMNGALRFGRGHRHHTTTVSW